MEQKLFTSTRANMPVMSVFRMPIINCGFRIKDSKNANWVGMLLVENISW